MSRTEWKFPVADRPQIVAAISARLATGEPMAEICRSPDMPCVDTVWRWTQEHDEIARSIARARLIGEDAIAIEALRIADGAIPDPAGKHDPVRDKLRVDTRLKLLAKWNPGKWGDRVQLRHADAEGETLDTAPLVRELLGLMRHDPG